MRSGCHHSRALATREHVEEVHNVLVFGEHFVVVEVDVVAPFHEVAGRRAAAGKNLEEVEHVLIFWEDAIVVKVDVIANDRRLIPLLGADIHDGRGANTDINDGCDIDEASVAGKVERQRIAQWRVVARVDTG